MTPEEKEEKLHLIQLDWSSKDDAYKIGYADDVLDNDIMNEALWQFVMQDEAGFRRFLEDNYNLEQKYIDEKWEDD